MNGRGGFVLIAALWLLVAISAASLGLALGARGDRLTAQASVDAVLARAAAEAGFADAAARLRQVLQLAQRGSDAGPLVDAWHAADTLTVSGALAGGAAYRVTLRDAASRLDVNRASEHELRMLLVALRVDYGEADALAQTVADWRDADDVRRARGGERAEYIAAGAALLPTNRPFERIEELEQVMGMTSGIYVRLAPHVTVRGSGRVNLHTASLPVLLTLPGMSDEAADAVLRRRTRGERFMTGIWDVFDQLSPEARRALELEAPRLGSLVTLETSEVELVSKGEVHGRGGARIEAVLRRSGGDMAVVWRRTE